MRFGVAMLTSCAGDSFARLEAKIRDGAECQLSVEQESKHEVVTGTQGRSTNDPPLIPVILDAPGLIGPHDT